MADDPTKTPAAAVEPPAPPSEGTPPEPPPEPPPYDPKTATLADYRRKKAADEKAAEGTDDGSPPAAPKPEEPPKPEDDDEPDPDVQAEIDRLEKPADGETPQDRSARTKRNRRKAQRAYATRVTRERDEARQELKRIKDLEAGSARRPAPLPPPLPAPDAGPKWDGSNPKDLAPKRDAFPEGEAGDQQFFSATVQWEARKTVRQDRFHHQQQRTRADSVERERAERLDEDDRKDRMQAANAEYAKTHADFDETTLQVPYGPRIIMAATYLDAPGPVLYYLARNPNELNEVRELFRTNPRAGFLRLGRLEATLTAASEQPPKPSTAPAPPEQVGGGRSAPAAPAAEFDPTTADLAAYRREKKRREAAEGAA